MQRRLLLLRSPHDHPRSRTVHRARIHPRRHSAAAPQPAPDWSASSTGTAPSARGKTLLSRSVPHEPQAGGGNGGSGISASGGGNRDIRIMWSWRGGGTGRDGRIWQRMRRGFEEAVGEMFIRVGFLGEGSGAWGRCMMSVWDL